MALLKTKKDKEEFLTWVAWLWAGVLPQGKGSLETWKNTYCCLGVACVLLIPEDKLDVISSPGFERTKLSGGSLISQNQAPHWLKNINFDFEDKTGENLITLNDKYHERFLTIARKLLEAYKEELEAIK